MCVKVAFIGLPICGAVRLSAGNSLGRRRRGIFLAGRAAIQEQVVAYNKFFSRHDIDTGTIESFQLYMAAVFGKDNISFVDRISFVQLAIGTIL